MEDVFGPNGSNLRPMTVRWYDPERAYEELSIAEGFIPFVSDFKDVLELSTGRDLFTQRPLTSLQQGFAAAGIALPLVSGGTLMAITKGAGKRVVGEVLEDSAERGTREILQELADRALREVRQEAAEEAGIKAAEVTLKGPVAGTRIHTRFRELVDELNNLRLKAEVSYRGGQFTRWGRRGSVRLDVVEYADENNKVVEAVYDLKTGAARLSKSRIRTILNHLPHTVPVIGISPR